MIIACAKAVASRGEIGNRVLGMFVVEGKRHMGVDVVDHRHLAI